MSQEILIGFVIALILISFYIGRISRNTSLHNHPDLIRLQAEVNFQIKQIEQLQLEKQTLEEHADILRHDNQELIARISIRDTEYTHLTQRLNTQQVEFEALQKKFTTEFENLATKILEEKSRKFTSQNQTNLESILTPLHEKIQSFEQKIAQSHKESIDYHAALRQQIIGLQELNHKMSQETLNLTKALKGSNKMQGNWGELILERILEKSGLEKGREYESQQTLYAEDGKRLQPDIVIHMPDRRFLIIDAKVSLLAYERYINTTDEKQKATSLQEHLHSIKRHLENLSSKKYHDLYPNQTPDFVLLFIPIESAFSIAVNSEPDIYLKAFEKNIVIVTPTTLLATLRTIETIWKQQKQQQNAYEIAKQAGLLYDKFVGLLESLSGLGKKIDGARQEYEKALSKLSTGKGNLLSSVQKLKKMGARSRKYFPNEFDSKAHFDE